MVSPLLLSSAWSSIAASALGKGLQACHAVSQHLLHVISSCGKDTCHSHSGSSTAATRPSCNGRPAHGSSWNLVQHNRPAETPTYRTLLHDSVCSADALSFAQARRQYNTSSSSEARSSSKSRSRGWPAVASRGAAKTLHQRNQGITAQQQPRREQQQQQQQQQVWRLPQQELNARQLTSCVATTSSPSTLLQLLQQHSGVVNHIHVAAAAGQLAHWRKAGHNKQDSIQQQHVTQVLELLEQLLLDTPQTEQQQKQQQQLIELEQTQQSLLQQCSSRELSQLGWALAVLRYTHTSLFPACVDACLQQLPVLLHQPARNGAQHISNMLYGVAVAGQGQLLQPHQLQQLLTAFIQQLRGAKPQEVSVTLWAVASIGQAVPQQQLRQLLTTFLGMLPAAKPQEISNLLWAVATMWLKVPKQQLIHLLSDFSSKAPLATAQAVSNSLWAAAALQQQSEQPLKHQQDPQQGQVEQVQQQQVELAQQLLALTAALAEKLSEATPQAVANALWACTRFNLYPAALLAALERQQQQWQRLQAGMAAQEAASIALSSGKLGYSNVAFMQALMEQICNVHQQVQQQQQQGDESSSDGSSGSTEQAITEHTVCNISWAVAALDMRQLAGSVVDLLRMLARSAPQRWETFTADGHTQLHQVHLWLRDLVGGQGLAGVLSEQQLQQCQAAMATVHSASAALPPSYTQLCVFSAIQELHKSGRLQLQEAGAVMEHSTRDHACIVDIAAVMADGVRLAVEVDGPVHFLLPDRRLDGNTRHRNRMLAAQGYAVVSVPYFEWDKLQGRKQQQDYLLARVQQALHACRGGSAQ